MADIKAFVAHSFLPQDQDLIRKFLDYFNSLKGVLPSFSWDHAKEARPTDGEKTVMRFNEDYSEIEVMERVDSRFPQFYVLARQPNKLAAA
jgi:hypothetical protein